MKQQIWRDTPRKAPAAAHPLAERLESLGLGMFRSVAELREIAAKRRGRRIEAVPFPLRGTNISGLLLVTPEADLIIYEQDAPAYHQEHTQLHELSHILLGHVDEETCSSHDTLAQLPQLYGHTITKVLQRTDYAERVEHEAEALASLLAMRLRLNVELAQNTPESEELRRVARSLSPPRPAG